MASRAASGRGGSERERQPEQADRLPLMPPENQRFLTGGPTQATNDRRNIFNQVSIGRQELAGEHHTLQSYPQPLDMHQPMLKIILDEIRDMKKTVGTLSRMVNGTSERMDVLAADVGEVHELVETLPHVNEETTKDLRASKLQLENELIVLKGHYNHIYEAHESLRNENKHLETTNQDLQQKMRQWLSEQQPNADLQQQLERDRATLQQQLEHARVTVRELENEKSALESDDCECQKPNCIFNRKALEKAQEEAQLLQKAYNPAKKLSETSGGDYDGAFQDFEEFTTIPEGLLQVLEENLGDVLARQAQCQIFQTVYNTTKGRVKWWIQHALDFLFTPGTRKRKQTMEDISRAYSHLLQASELTTSRTRREAIINHVCTVVLSIYRSHPKLGGFLKKEHLRKAVEIAWKFLTFPNPVIVVQPDTFDSKIHQREYGHWDPASEGELVYSRPVIYRCYEGQPQYKGTVANCGHNEFIQSASKNKRPQ